jgi:hypothetical protein
MRLQRHSHFLPLAVHHLTRQMSDADVLARLEGLRASPNDGAEYAKAQLTLAPALVSKDGEEQEEEEPAAEEANADGAEERPEPPRQPSYVRAAAVCVQDFCLRFQLYQSLSLTTRAGAAPARCT